MGNQHEKLGLKRIPCATELTIPDTAGNSPVPAGNYSTSATSNVFVTDTLGYRPALMPLREPCIL